MTDAALPFVPPLDVRRGSYLDEGHTILSWLTTTDHKRIAILYALSITVFFLIGGVAIGLVRLELISPTGLFLTSDEYNRLFTIHGIIMVWFFLVPSIPATMGNFLVPMMIGAPDVAFPRLNLLSWYLYVGGAVFTVYVLLSGGVDTGWTFYPPFSSEYSHSNVIPAAIGVFIVGFSSIATGVNFLATIHMLRAPGMTWFRLPLFVWSMYTVSVVMVLATPVLAMSLLLIVAERLFGLPIFDPSAGGDPVLFQHLFWFYSHPAVYIMILPAMGVVSEVFACFARRRVFGYGFMVFAMLMIAVVGFMVWGHHMFVAGQSPLANLIFSFLSFIVAVPSAIKVFNWTATLYRGHIGFEAPMIYALGFLGLFTIGGLTGLFLASVPIDIATTDTYFVVAHFHTIMVGGTVSAFMAGIHYWWPKVTGKLYNEFWAQLAAITMFLGFNLTFLPQFIMGWLGMPRRYHYYPDVFQIWHVLSSGGAVILAAAYLMPLVYLTWSLFCGQDAGNNPWRSTGLEWQTPSPPPKTNFLRPPRVDADPYDYHDFGRTEETGGEARARPQGEA
ncbi:MAG TPA: cbb3-type cytochrome c oxidase subunit I [Xanthobacteraceae bacterium]|nr:cbb3-type cytochrome c oxidase subunit I [Xanthobacteraceae bacterium]